MTEDELSRRLDALQPKVCDEAIEMALHRTRTVAQTRQRRRRTALRLAPVLAAAATVAVVLLAIVGSGHDSHSPAVGPTPVPSASINAWFRHATGVSSPASGSVDLSSVWVVRLTDANHGTFDVRPSTRFGTGTFHFDGSRGGWVVDILDRACGGRAGVYEVQHDGPSLTFTAIKDPCQLRRDLLDNAVFAPLSNPDQLTG